MHINWKEMVISIIILIVGILAYYAIKKLIDRNNESSNINKTYLNVFTSIFKAVYIMVIIIIIISQ